MLPFGARGQCVTVMSVRRGGSLATPTPAPAPADGNPASDSGAWVCGSQRRAGGAGDGSAWRTDATGPGRAKAVRNHEKAQLLRELRKA